MTDEIIIEGEAIAEPYYSEEAKAKLETLSDTVKDLKAGIDFMKQDVVVVDVKGVPTAKVIDRPKAEADMLAANINEPQEATEAEIAAIDEATQKVVDVNAGFLDGSTRGIKQIVDKSDGEKKEYQNKLANERIAELKALLIAGEATATQKTELDLLIKTLNI
jgi:hypothetical protein